MGFSSVLPFSPETSPLPDMDTVAIVAGVSVPNYKLPVRAGFSDDRPRKIRNVTIPNDNTGRDDGEFHRGMLHDIIV
jgi:hypothetical protein